ncbi:MAG: alpha/beta hydrolase [Candidatus Berkiella sp.]
MNTLLNAVVQLLLIYLLIAFTFWFASDLMLFQPPKVPRTIATHPHAITIPLANQQTLSAVYLPNTQAKYTLLFSHGNAEDLFTLSPFLKLLQQHGFAVFAYDYPGYGNSTGKATEASTYQAIQAAYQYLTTELGVPNNRIIVFGRSLGSGPSVELCQHNKVAGLILESPFVSAYRVYSIWPIFPFDKYTNLDKIPKLSVPILLIHGTRDSVIPIWHGKKIYEAAASPKQAYWVEGASHNDVLITAQMEYFKTLQQFASSLKKD